MTVAPQVFGATHFALVACLVPGTRSLVKLKFCPLRSSGLKKSSYLVLVLVRIAVILTRNLYQ